MNTKVWLQVVSGVLNGLITAGALFTTLFGQDMTLKIIACLGLSGIIVNAVSAPFLTQSATIKEVAAMPGIEPLKVNANANQTVAQLAMNPDVNKIGPTPSAADAVEKTAKGS